VRKPLLNGPLGKPTGCEVDIEMDLRKSGCEELGWMEVA